MVVLGAKNGGASALLMVTAEVEVKGAVMDAMTHPLSQALTDALAFDFSIPTPQGVGVKNLVFGVACGVSAIIVALSLFAASRSRERDFTLVEDQPAEQHGSHLKKQIDAFQGAQVLLVLLLR